MASAHAQHLTADSVWSPPAAVLAVLPYGGNLHEAVRQNDRAAVEAIKALYAMGPMGNAVNNSPCPPCDVPKEVGDHSGQAQSDYEIARSLQRDKYHSPPPVTKSDSQIAHDLQRSEYNTPPPVTKSDSEIARGLQRSEYNTPPPVTKSDSQIAREMADAEYARDLERQAIEERASFDCPICAESKPKDGSFTGTCDHRTCGDCIYNHIVTKVEAKETSEAQLRCMFCPEPLKPEQVIGVLKTYERADLVTTFLEERLASSTQGGSGPFCSCPKCSLVAFLDEEEARVPFRATCVHDRCAHSFCSRCATPRYHFFHPGERDPPDCAELMRQKEASWLQWRAHGQSAYLDNLARVDGEYAARLKAFESETAESRRAYEAFQADEAAKASWVHCPHCNVLWAGSDACSHVTCGILEQAMGQKRATVGCGRQFDLSNARRYQPAQAPPPQPAAARPEKPSAVTHEHIACDQCGTSPIQGVRIRCLHCPSYNLCLPCLAQNGPDHEAEEEWPGRDEAPHIFEVLHAPVGVE